MATQIHLENIDFIKGLAALSVILLHTLPKSVLYGSFAVYHIWQAVPIFLFITFYLGFRNFEKTGNVFNGYYSMDRLKKVFQKLWLPLLILAVFEAIFFTSIGNNSRAVGSLLCISNGPGSYYIWVYMQLWVLLPLIFALFKKCGVLIGGSILLIISAVGDFIIEKYVSFTPVFFCFRYLFLSVPAYMYLKRIKIKEIWSLILLSVVYLSLMHYSGIPERFDSILPNGWEAQTSLGFFYTLFLFVLLSKIYEKIKNSKLTKYITHYGTISWEIFLVQMVLLGSGVVEFASTRVFQSIYLQVGFKVIFVLTLSLLIAQLYKNFLNVIILRIRSTIGDFKL